MSHRVIIRFVERNTNLHATTNLGLVSTGAPWRVLETTMYRGHFETKYVKQPYHVIGFSDLIDLWVIKIKKPMILCVRSTSSTKRRSCERFDHSITKITRLYDYQTWQTHFLRSSRGAQRFVGFLPWLCFSDVDWLRSRGTSSLKSSSRAKKWNQTNLLLWISWRTKSWTRLRESGPWRVVLTVQTPLTGLNVKNLLIPHWPINLSVNIICVLQFLKSYRFVLPQETQSMFTLKTVSNALVLIYDYA